MNWTAWGPTIVAVATAIFTAGSIVRRVSDHDKRLDNHESRLTIVELSQARSEGWQNGFNAALAKKEE